MPTYESKPASTDTPDTGLPTWADLFTTLKQALTELDKLTELFIHGPQDEPEPTSEPPPTLTPYWRVGTSYGQHVYRGNIPIATFHTVADARDAVHAYNESVNRKLHPGHPA